MEKTSEFIHEIEGQGFTYFCERPMNYNGKCYESVIVYKNDKKDFVFEFDKKTGELLYFGPEVDINSYNPNGTIH